MNITYLNYEYAAVEAISTDPNWKPFDISLLFTKTRKKEVVLARQFLMYYRMLALRKSQAAAAERYSLDHATALHASEKLDFYFRKYPAYKRLYNKFLSLVDTEFTGKLYKEYEKIEATTSELYSISCALNGSFESHEAAMLKFNEVESHLVEFKKLILEKWKER